MKGTGFHKFGNVTLYNQNVLTLYHDWRTPDVIVSDGGYGVSGFRGDAHEPSKLKGWYEPHINRDDSR